MTVLEAAARRLHSELAETPEHPCLESDEDVAACLLYRMIRDFLGRFVGEVRADLRTRGVAP